MSALRTKTEHTVFESEVLKKFKCLQDKCPDSCCHAWNVQVDSITEKIFKDHDDLKEIIKTSKDICILKKDEQTGECVKYENGLCGVHKKYGEDYLPDACNFYPKVMYKSDDLLVSVATLSCPEIARIAMEQDPNDFKLHNVQYNRIIEDLRNHNYENINKEAKLAINDLFLKFVTIGNNSVEQKILTSKQSVLKIIMVARSIASSDYTKWFDHIIGVESIALNLVPKPIDNDLYPYYIIQMLIILLMASKNMKQPRLDSILSHTHNVLGVNINKIDSSVTFSRDKINNYKEQKSKLSESCVAEIDEVMKRWIIMQLQLMFYPIGIQQSMLNHVNAANILAIKYAINRLTLTCYAIENKTVNGGDVLQPLARNLDHIKEYGLLLNMIESYNLHQDANLVGLLEAI